MPTRRDFLRVAALALVARPRDLHAFVPSDVIVYKSPSCGCCAKWVDHVRAAGYTVTVHGMEDVTEVKRSLGVPEALRSCHTALAGKYVIEGHVPADLIRRLQKERRNIVGLAVPGMVTGSPGMEGGSPAPYDIVAFDGHGTTTVFATR